MRKIQTELKTKPPKGLISIVRWLIFGQPIANQDSDHTLLSKLIALPVLCSDAISSVAYGGQQIILALCAAGLWLPQYHDIYTAYNLKISCSIALLLAIVTLSYRQTIFTYPNGGGSYIVSKENLGLNAGLIAAAALLIDYVLTVSVSVAAGIQNLKDVPLLTPLHIGEHLVAYSLGAISLIVFSNLRGLKQSGTLFAVPVYLFIALSYVMIFLGLFGPIFGWFPHLEFVNQIIPNADKGLGATFQVFGLAVLLRAFANGCSAMTGVEAISNGIPIFKEPKTTNAAITLMIMALILGTLFMGIAALSVNYHVVYWENNGITAPAVIDQLSGAVFGKNGPGSWLYVLMQLSTASILIIAAQTSFADFPRLASILARDGFLPRQLMNVGDRLAFNNGILALGILSALFIIIEKGSVDLLIPFFAIGVFLAFTMSQTGMVRHWFTHKGNKWQTKALINGLGALASFLVVIDIAVEKFLAGAWFIILIAILLLILFKRIYAHYAFVAKELSLANYHPAKKPMGNIVLVLVQSVNIGTLNALEYARSISKDCQAVFVETEPNYTSSLKEVWAKEAEDIPLIVLNSPYRSLLSPLMDYLDEVHEEKPHHRITVVISELILNEWWAGLLHGNTGLLLKLALLSRKDIVVANVRYPLSGEFSQH